MIFKKIGNMENVEAICHYFLSIIPTIFLATLSHVYLLAHQYRIL